MKTTKLLAYAMAVLITLALSSAAKAQKATIVSFKGIEVTAGHAEPGEAYGWMCYARTTGDLPGNFTLTMDFEGTKEPGTVSAVTGGAWTLPVYVQAMRGASYMGVLYGRVLGGDAIWGKEKSTVELKMIIDGGTQTLLDLRGNAVLYGTFSYDSKGVPTFEGSIYFEFQ